MFRKCGYLLALCFPFFLQAGWFDTPLSPRAQKAAETLKGFDEKIEKALKEYQIPGVAIGVIVDGHVIYAKGHGLADVEEQLPVTEKTLFPIGSCTKAFTAFLIGTLVDEGRFAWDDRVIDILPDFRLKDQYATQNLTIRDLLTHRSGMPRHDYMWYNTNVSRADLLKRLRHLEPSTDIRERYQYNNLMYLTAACAMEHLTGKSWEELIQDKILTPLGMHETCFSVAEMQKKSDYASGYIEKNEGLKNIPFRDISVIGPAGSMNSNIAELLNWLQLQINKGIFNGHSLISPSTLQETQTPQVIIPGTPELGSLFSAYGMGWTMSIYKGHYYLAHDGGSDGFTSLAACMPDEKVSVVILCNKNLTSFPRDTLLELFYRIFEHPESERHLEGNNRLIEGAELYRRGKEAMKDKKVKEEIVGKRGTSPSHSLEDYVGSYDNPGYGVVDVDLIDGKLQVTYNGVVSFLDHWNYDVFVVSEHTQDLIYPYEGSKLSFITNPNGDVDQLTIPFELKAADIAFKKKPLGKFSTQTYLKQFAGIYEVYGFTVELVVRDHYLYTILPGEPMYQLLPTGENEFTVKQMVGYDLRFIMNDQGQVEEALLIQPYGVFSAKPKR